MEESSRVDGVVKLSSESGPVRVEYDWLARETRLIVQTFGFDLSPATWLDHDRLMDGCECLDRKVDGSPNQIRGRLSKDVIAALRARDSEGFGLDAELEGHVATLVDIFSRYAEPEYFISRAARIFEIAEQLRSVSDRTLYMNLVCEEGRCFLEMFLPLFAVHATPEFMSWFPSVAEVGNLVDKLVDARADYRRGEMRVQPDLTHHLALLKEIVLRGYGAFRLFPRPFRLFWWAIRFFDPRRHISARVKASDPQESPQLLGRI